MDDNNVIPLSKNKPVDPKVKELFDFGLAIDNLVLDGVSSGLELFELAGILSNRLGEVIRNLPAKEHQVDVLLNIILKQAELTDV